MPQLDFSLEGAGWASLKISSGSFSYRIDGISYLSDALDDLLRMGIDIATAKTWAFTEFDHEPASTILVAETAWIENNNWVWGARLSSFDGTPYKESGVSWCTLRTAPRDFILPVGSADELATMFLEAGQRVLDEHAAAGYREAWGGRLGFPTRAMEALRAALNCPPTAELNYS